MSTSQKNKAKNETKGLWTIVIILGIMFFIFFIFSGALYFGLAQQQENLPQIAVVEINGNIQSADQTVRNIMQFAQDDNIKGILIRLESPGGAVGASQEIREAIQALNKPAVFSMGNIAASGAYYIACAGPKIFANPSSITGSIGVISQVINVNEILERLQLKIFTIKTGPFKDTGSPVRPFTQEDEAYLSQLGFDIYNQFVDIVTEARKISREEVLKLADGRVFTGTQAKEFKLIDELGGFYAAVEYLKAELSITGPVQLSYPSTSNSQILEKLLREGVQSIQQGIQNAQNPSKHFQYLYQGNNPQ